MFTKNITSRYLTTTLLLLLFSSLSVTALPCVCPVNCDSGPVKQKNDGSRADVCDIAADQVTSSSQCASASSDAPLTSKVSSTCDCESSTAPQLIRFQQQRPNWLTSSLEISFNPVADLKWFDRRTERLDRRFRTTTGCTATPFYLRNASLLL